MSEVQKAVEETPAVVEPVEAPKAEETPVVAAETPAAETSTETPAETAPAATEEPAAAETAETPAAPFAGSGVLGYKAPSGNILKKLAGFKQTYFWVQEEPIHHKSLASYLRGEKETEYANHNAAWSTHTGKGLLFHGKSEADKAKPTGVINLADVKDVEDDGTLDFSIKTEYKTHTGTHTPKHVFSTTSVAVRDQWVAFLKSEVEAAKSAVESVTGSETYKTEKAALSPAPVVAPVPAKKEEKKEAKEEVKKEAKEEKKEEKKERKSRSASRKRGSIFGGFGLNKKEEKPAEAAAETPAPTEPVAAVDGPAETPAPVVEPAVAAPAAEEPVATETKDETKPSNKRKSSLFESLKFVSKKETKTETPAVPAKDTEAAPVIPAVEATEPLDTSASPASVPVETTEVANGIPAEEPTPEVKTETKKTDKRKSSIPFGGIDGLKKRFGTVKKSKSPAPEEQPAAAEPAKEEEAPVVSEPTPVTTAGPTPVSAAA